jgi:hypothetical protein
MAALRSLRFAVAGVFLLAVVGACSRRPVAEASRERAAVPVAAPAHPAAASAAVRAPEPAPAEPVRPDDLPKVDLNHLNLEVTALEMLYQMRLTPAQLAHLVKLVPATSLGLPPPREVAVSPELTRALHEMRAALLENDDEKIDEASGKLDKLRDKESPDFDEVEISEGARKHTPEFFRTLSARQVASYLTDYADEFPDPLEKIQDAFDDVRKLPGREWEEMRDEVAGQVGWLVAGLDYKAEEAVSKQVTDLLNLVHGLKDEDYKAQRGRLDAEARAIVAKVGPTDVIRHFVERSLAELLSNPCVAAAVEARRKKEN